MAITPEQVMKMMEKVAENMQEQQQKFMIDIIEKLREKNENEKESEDK